MCREPDGLTLSVTGFPVLTAGCRDAWPEGLGQCIRAIIVVLSISLDLLPLLRYTPALSPGHPPGARASGLTRPADANYVHLGRPP